VGKKTGRKDKKKKRPNHRCARSVLHGTERDVIRRSGQQQTATDDAQTVHRSGQPQGRPARCVAVLRRSVRDVQFGDIARLVLGRRRGVEGRMAPLLLLSGRRRRRMDGRMAPRLVLGLVGRWRRERRRAGEPGRRRRRRRVRVAVLADGRRVQAGGDLLRRLVELLE